MQRQIEFKYFPEYEKWAVFTNEKCICPDDLPCLEPIHFDDPDIEDPVCLDQLVNGQVRVDIPAYLQKRLLDSILKTHPSWSGDQTRNFAAQVVDTLSRTPPIPWIQNNDWPVCCGDFCCYLGEWSQEQLTESSSEGNGSSFLWGILADYRRNRRDAPGDIWQEIESGWTTIYVFRCFDCNKLIAVDQSY
jgi:hypothetical protein